MMRAGCYFLLIVFLAFQTGCGRDTSLGQPVELLDGIYSQQTYQQLREKFPERSVRQRLHIESDANMFRDAYAMRSATLDNYQHQGMNGTLEFVFFQDQLMSAIFYPEECDKVDETAFTVAKDSQGRCYIERSDPSVVERHDSWITKNA